MIHTKIPNPIRVVDVLIGFVGTGIIVFALAIVIHKSDYRQKQELFARRVATENIVLVEENVQDIKTGYYLLTNMDGNIMVWAEIKVEFNGSYDLWETDRKFLAEHNDEAVKNYYKRISRGTPK